VLAVQLSVALCVRAVTPVPASGTANVELLAVLVTEMLPLKDPGAAGAKLALKLSVCPGERVTGRAGLCEAKYVPAALILETLNEALPEFFSVMVCVHARLAI
jgi:hypothetical protein